MRFLLALLSFTLAAYCSAFPTPPLGRLHSDNAIWGTEETQEWDTLSSLKYLGRFGYMSKRKLNSQLSSLIDRKSYSKALRKFQKMFDLEPTGELDAQTQRMMSLPRCGVKDSPKIVAMNGGLRGSLRKTQRGGRSRSKRYVHQGGRWRKRSLKYHIVNYTPDLTEAEVKISIKKAFELWSNHTNLEFTATSSARDADIRISFGSDDHGDYYPFDGQGGELAHAFYPSDGRTHFDEAERYTFEGNGRGVDLYTVAAHEFGHNLGLAHSTVPDSLMAPVYKGYVPNLKLHSDDINGIQQLYGRKVAASPSVAPVNVGDELCQDTVSYDAMHYDQIDEALYVFMGSKFWKINERGVVKGYPKKIRHVWRSLPDNIDASFYSQVTRRTYFFKGNKIWRFNRLQLEAGFPQPSSALGLPTHPDAALQIKRDAMVYILKGDRLYRFSEYQRYDGRNLYGSGKIDGYWKGLPARVDAAITWEDGNAYFVRGDKVWSFSGSRKPIDDEYPKSFKSTWLKCQNGKLTSERNRPSKIHGVKRRRKRPRRLMDSNRRIH